MGTLLIILISFATIINASLAMDKIYCQNKIDKLESSPFYLQESEAKGIIESLYRSCCPTNEKPSDKFERSEYDPLDRYNWRTTVKDELVRYKEVCRDAAKLLPWHIVLIVISLVVAFIAVILYRRYRRTRPMQPLLAIRVQQGVPQNVINRY